jgi:uncharacterized membrane protein YbhN (UPF0104 family)
MRNARRLLQISGALLASVGIGYFVVRKLSLQDLLRLAHAADARLLVLGLALYLLANLLRARRFRALTDDRIATLPLLRTVLIQNFLNTFLPFRAGEVSYLVMVHRTGAVTAGTNLASLLGARVLDLVAALMIPLLTLPLSRAWASADLPFAWFAGLTAFGITCLVVGLWQAPALAGWLERRTVPARPWLARALAIAASTLSALAQLRKGKLLARIGGLTAGCWLLIYLSGYVTLLGVGVAVPFWDAVFAYSFPVVASMTPFYMLGGFGVYEGSIGFGLHLIGVPLATSMAAGVFLHITELLFVVLPAPFGLVPSAAAVAKRSA